MHRTFKKWRKGRSTEQRITQQIQQAASSEQISVGDVSGDRAEPFPFVALSVDDSNQRLENNFPPTQPILQRPRFPGGRRGLQEDVILNGGENDSHPTSISPHADMDQPSDISSSAASTNAVSSTHIRQEVLEDYGRAIFNPQHIRHGISQDNQHIRREIQQTLASNYQPSQAIAIFSNDGQRRLFAGYTDAQLPPRQLEEESSARHASEPFLLENQIDQQKEWLEVEFHPRLQSALLDRHHQHRDEEFLVEYAKHLKDGSHLSPRIQDFLMEQARALERLAQQPPSNARAASHEDSSSRSSDQHSSSSISMRIWMNSHVTTSELIDQDQSYASSEANQTNVSELILMPPSPKGTRREGDDQSEKDDADDMDSRFSDVDYMTDYQWTALRRAIVKSNNSSLVGKYKKALKASADLPPQPVPPKRTISHPSSAPGRGFSRMPNYDRGDDELEPLVRKTTPPPQKDGQDHDQPAPHPMDTPKPPQEQIQLAMNEAIGNIQTRVCQICQQNILEKEEYESNKIRCSMCGATSCYFCRKTIPASGVDHFNTDPTCLVSDGKCPLWTDRQTDLEQDKKLARDMLMEIADQVLQETFPAKR